MKRNTKKHNKYLFVLSHLCTEEFLQQSPVAGHFKDNELCPIQVTPGSSLFPELWPDSVSLTWMPLRHLKPSRARAKLYSLPYYTAPSLPLLHKWPPKARNHETNFIRPLHASQRTTNKSYQLPEHTQTLPTFPRFKLPPLPSGLSQLAPYCSHWFHPYHLHLFTARQQVPPSSPGPTSLKPKPEPK